MLSKWKISAVVMAAAASGVAAPCFAQSAAENAAHDAQNPIANVISVPFQDNTYFDAGSSDRAQNVLLVQPVVPIKLGDDWNIITRTIVPIINQPHMPPLTGSTFGLGNIQPQFYLSPSRTGEIIWGVGPQFWLPTATDKTVGVNRFGAGPAGVALTIQGPWVLGGLVSTMWAGSDRNGVNETTVQPIAFYNMAKGWYVMSSPVITSNWLKESNERWTVPAGGGFGRLFTIGGQIVNARIQLFNNVVRPTDGDRWQAQFQIQFLFK